MALIPDDKIVFERNTYTSSVCYRKYEFSYVEGGKAGSKHAADLALKCCGACGFEVKFPEAAGFHFDVSKTCLLMYNKYEIKGASGDVKATLQDPSCFDLICNALRPCGSHVIMKVFAAGEDSPRYLVRTPEVCCTCCNMPCSCTCDGCCTKKFRVELPITPADKFDTVGKIIVESEYCCCGWPAGMLKHESNITIEFPRDVTADLKHALMAVGMLTDLAFVAGNSWCGQRS